VPHREPDKGPDPGERLSCRRGIASNRGRDRRDPPTMEASWQRCPQPTFRRWGESGYSQMSEVLTVPRQVPSVTCRRTPTPASVSLLERSNRGRGPEASPAP